MGVLYYYHAVALFEDLGIEQEEVKKNSSLKEFYSRVDSAYEQAAFNCWIAACLSFITIAYCASKFYEAAHDAMTEDSDWSLNEEGMWIKVTQFLSAWHVSIVIKRVFCVVKSNYIVLVETDGREHN